MSTPVGYFTRLLRGEPTNANRAVNARTINARRRQAARVGSRKRNKSSSRSRSRSTKRVR